MQLTMPFLSFSSIFLHECVLGDVTKTYQVYQDVHVMIWIGFGFLMTFLRKYSQSAVGLTFLIGAVLVQVALLCDGVLNIGNNGKAGLSLEG